jgi:hypothetical protein
MSGSSRAWTTLLLLVACTSLAACYKLVPLPDGVQPEGVTAGEQVSMPIVQVPVAKALSPLSPCLTVHHARFISTSTHTAWQASV